jgi:hypothetical protein
MRSTPYGVLFHVSPDSTLCHQPATTIKGAVTRILVSCVMRDVRDGTISDAAQSKRLVSILRSTLCHETCHFKLSLNSAPWKASGFCIDSRKYCGVRTATGTVTVTRPLIGVSNFLANRSNRSQCLRYYGCRHKYSSPPNRYFAKTLYY